MGALQWDWELGTGNWELGIDLTFGLGHWDFNKRIYTIRVA